MPSPPRFTSIFKYESVQLAVHGDPDREGGNANITREGFVLIKVLEQGVYLVMSIANNKFYLVKVLERRPGLHRGQLNEREFLHTTPPEVRVSSLTAQDLQQVPGVNVSLDAQPFFPRMEFFQQMNDRWTVYYRYANGGTLEHLIQVYHNSLVAIPETFIWHVAAKLSAALGYLYFGQSRDHPHGRQGWRAAYHRAIHPSNILLHYDTPDPWAHKRNVGIVEYAFPQIILSNFSQSAIHQDNNHWLQPGLHRTENRPNMWEDIYQVGCVLRLLCMTHIPPQHGIVPGSQVKDETGQSGWNDRPDSRRLNTVNAAMAINQANPQGYSDLLLDTLSEFEWATQEDFHIASVGLRQNAVPDIDWIVSVLQPTAEGEVHAFKSVPPRNGPGPKDYYTNVSVSWTRPVDPPPPVVVQNRQADHARFSTDLMIPGRLINPCEIHFPIPKRFNR
ncbi:hypothetical protein F4774DRAFT_426998 [Daldinia eschscholtzii]|nr:hypothetical protein F4774DRAFT_426998 [Daldinia eschscholtzii]